MLPRVIATQGSWHQAVTSLSGRFSQWAPSPRAGAESQEELCDCSAAHIQLLGAQLNSKTRESTFNGVFDVPPCPPPDCISETVPSNQKAPAQSFLVCVKARAGTSWGNLTCVQRAVSVGRGGRTARRCPLLSPVEVLVLHRFRQI